MGFYANFNALKRSSNSYKLHWPIPSFEVDELLSVISPLRMSSFYLFDDARPRLLHRADPEDLIRQQSMKYIY